MSPHSRKYPHKQSVPQSVSLCWRFIFVHRDTTSRAELLVGFFKYYKSCLMWNFYWTWCLKDKAASSERRNVTKWDKDRKTRWWQLIRGWEEASVILLSLTGTRGQEDLFSGNCGKLTFCFTFCHRYFYQCFWSEDKSSLRFFLHIWNIKTKQEPSVFYCGSKSFSTKPSVQNLHLKTIISADFLFCFYFLSDFMTLGWKALEFCVKRNLCKFNILFKMFS